MAINPLPPTTKSGLQNFANVMTLFTIQVIIVVVLVIIRLLATQQGNLKEMMLLESYESNAKEAYHHRHCLPLLSKVISMETMRVVTVW